MKREIITQLFRNKSKKVEHECIAQFSSPGDDWCYFELQCLVSRDLNMSVSHTVGGRGYLIHFQSSDPIRNTLEG